MTPAHRALPMTALAGVLTLLVVGMASAERQPARKTVDQPLYTHSETGFDHFVQDQLPGLVEGQTWEWRGQRYEVVRLHRVAQTELSRPRRASRNRDPGTRGWTIAIVHVLVDGELKRGRVEATAGYAWEPGGWIWEGALLYLGVGSSYDFVRGMVV